MNWTRAFGVSVLTLALLAGSMLIASTGAAQSRSIDEMIANAKTPADDRAIATYYDNEAIENRSKAKLHRKLAEFYRKFHTKPTERANHCEQMAKYFSAAADEAAAMAKIHRDLAGLAK